MLYKLIFFKPRRVVIIKKDSFVQVSHHQQILHDVLVKLILCKIAITRAAVVHSRNEVNT